MKRSLVLVGALLLAGCGGDAPDDLISNTVNAMDEAAKQLDTLAKDINKSVDKAKKDGTTQVDFSEAVKYTDKLAKTGMKMQAIKGQLEAMRGKVTPEEQQQNAEEKKSAINQSFKRLVEGKNELDKSLQAAAELNRNETKKLEEKIREALGTFESLARQSS
jgi:outer membrane murein-binding lipoprotein Lpp